MSKPRQSTAPYDKRRRNPVHRSRAIFDSPESGPSHVLAPITVRARQEGLQSSTGRRLETVRATVVPEDSWSPPDNLELGLDPDSIGNDAALEADGIWHDTLSTAQAQDAVLDENKTKKKKKKKRKALRSARPMVYWINGFRDKYLDELLRSEGRGDAWADGEGFCADCCARGVGKPGNGEYRCQECFFPHLICQSCCVRRHRMLPFHIIQRWTGSTFVKCSLKSLGLRIQLNHLGLKCANPEPCHSKFTVLHTNGIHEVAFDYCNCRPLSKFRQLLRRGLYPSSQENPRSCATFTLLEQLHMVNLTTKCSTYDFYRALEKLTNNRGIDIPKSKYRLLLRILLQWRHLKMLKRAGRGHDESGARGTQEGELALVCPSCPHPGINIPDDWANASPEKSFLYFVFLCMDANFRLKNQLVSNYSQDPGLGIGWAYMIERKDYEAYVKSRASDLDDGDNAGCGLQAVDKAHTKFNKGLRYTGVTSVSCGRSEMVLPCSVGNLQRGERYANMDFSCGSAMRFVAILIIILSYDAACQWFVNLFGRIQNFWPSKIKPREGVSLAPLIPKLHEPGHKKRKGHEQFSCNFYKGAGNTDCECPERIWSGMNAVANSTKIMGPGSRQDVLDDHFSFWNHEKYINMGKTLARRYRKAVPERNRQTEAHRGFTASLDAKDVDVWTKMCEEWEAAPFPRADIASPYHVEGANLTQAQVQQELANEEEAVLAKGGRALHETSASAFLITALDIEEAQRRLSLSAASKDYDRTLISEQRNTVSNDIEKWRKVQGVYMPGLVQHLSNLEKTNPGSTLDSDKAELVKLWLPSDLPKAIRDDLCIAGLAASEEKLREAQCYDALDSIRSTLRLKTRMVQFKNKNIRGQRGGTRSRVLIDRVHTKAKRYAARYRAARKAKLALSGPGTWEKTLQELRDADVRAYQDPERVKGWERRKGTYEDSQQPFAMDVDAEDGEGDRGGIDLLLENRSRRDGTGQAHKVLSWIWTVENQGKSSLDMGDVLRSEWAKSRARVDRATEEVELLQEEMRRVLVYLDWKSNWWQKKQLSRAVQDKPLEEGLRAYCTDQESYQCALRSSFHTLWSSLLSNDDTKDNDGDDDDNDESDDDGHGGNGDGDGDGDGDYEDRGAGEEDCEDSDGEGNGGDNDDGGGDDEDGDDEV
ncbi:hypothetical protein CVT26_009777 [Gymnopilus dilepis]|uniref:CxC2-like cysteine cluster KDZ transposase-associated domain-containing protein n=1 Tax=Gymnopilus dilepis TaxID=231916 RepID=A0A409YIU9_9AGAR|nr:hypothetical protein CVT26_009777 [Gymnopilus dilepis]